MERQGSISSTASSRSTGTCNSSAAGSTVPPKHDETWIHEIFEGTLTNETRCLSCETVSVKQLVYYYSLLLIMTISCRRRGDYKHIFLSRKAAR